MKWMSSTTALIVIVAVIGGCNALRNFRARHVRAVSGEQGACTTAADCPSHMCCSKWGYCGVGQEFCGAGAQLRRKRHHNNDDVNEGVRQVFRRSMLPSCECNANWAECVGDLAFEDTSIARLTQTQQVCIGSCLNAASGFNGTSLSDDCEANTNWKGCMAVATPVNPQLSHCMRTCHVLTHPTIARCASQLRCEAAEPTLCVDNSMMLQREEFSDFLKWFIPILVPAVLAVFGTIWGISAQQGACKAAADCKSQMCCSKYGYCGVGKGYCDSN